jgi:hypothetical protein
MHVKISVTIELATDIEGDGHTDEELHQLIQEARIHGYVTYVSVSADPLTKRQAT